MATPSPPSTPVPPLAPVVVSDFAASDTLLTMGDLILRNPIQSTSIFFLIILASTGLEYTFELLGQHRNAYHRNIIYSTKEELAAVAFSQMILIFVSLVVGFSDTAKNVILLATLMIVYMCVNFSIYVVIVNVLQSHRALEWSYFEWGRLDLDALHGKQEVLFKSAREIFLWRARIGAKVRAALADNKEAPTSIMPVLFASYLGHVERSYLKESFDFTWVTWVVLIGIVIVDGLRSIAVNAAGTAGTSKVALMQILTFVFVIGWGLLGGLIFVSYVQQKRFSAHFNDWIRQKKFDQLAPETDSYGDNNNNNYNGRNNNRNQRSNNNNNRNGLLAQQDDASERKLPTDEERVEQLTKKFWFDSPRGSLSVLQVFMLGILWFTCVFCVGMVEFSWVQMGPYALLVYAAAAVPFFSAVLYFLPRALTDIFIAACISTDFDDDLITKSVNGQFDLRQIEEDDDSDEDGRAADDGDGDAEGGDGDHHKKFTGKQHGGGGGGKKGGGKSRGGGRIGGGGGAGEGNDQSLIGNGNDDDARFDDEIDAPLELVALGSGRTGAAPLRVQGNPAQSTDYIHGMNRNQASSITAGLKPGQFVWGPRRPIFTAPMGSAGQEYL